MKNFFEKTYASHAKSKTFSIENYALEYGLDLQARNFLSSYYKVKITSEASLKYYLTFWNYEALLMSLKYTQEHSSFYKNSLKKLDLNKLQILIQNENFTENTNKIKQLINNLLLELPFTNAQELALNTERFLAISHDEIEGVISIESSGTSSRYNKQIGNKKENIPAKRIYCSENDLISTIYFFFYGMQYLLDKERKNKIAVLMSGDRRGTVGNLMQEAMQKLSVECKIFGVSYDFDTLIQELIDFEPTCLIAIPSHAYTLVHKAEHTKLKNTIKTILLSGDTINKSLEEQISTMLECEVFTHYGMTEFGLGAAVDCNKHKGMHIRSLDLYIEILNDKEEQVHNGEYGEIVITSLSREAMPLIRYKTGDIGCIIDDICTCNSVLPRLKILGRKEEFFNTKAVGKVHLSEIQEFLYKNTDILDFEISIFLDKELKKSALVLAFSWKDTSEKTNINKYLTQLSEEICAKYNILNLSSIHVEKETDNKDYPLEITVDFLHTTNLEEYIIKAEKQAFPKKYIQISEGRFCELLKNT